jgi:hypothetical protein
MLCTFVIAMPLTNVCFAEKQTPWILEVALFFVVDDSNDFGFLIISKTNPYYFDKVAEGLSFTFPNTCIPAKHIGDHFPS